jgi:hypothetical protein
MIIDVHYSRNATAIDDVTILATSKCAVRLNRMKKMMWANLGKRGWLINRDC